MYKFIIIFLAVFVLLCRPIFAIGENELLVKTNQQRVLAKLPPLVINLKLSKAANIKANDLVNQNYWSHISPQGVSPSQLVRSLGYKFRVIGENLADGYSDADSVINAWMNSPGHRRNLLNPKFCDVGFASVGNITVQELGCQKKL